MMWIIVAHHYIYIFSFSSVLLLLPANYIFENRTLSWMIFPSMFVFSFSSVTKDRASNEDVSVDVITSVIRQIQTVNYK